jgi:hypothetical protein
MTHIAAAAEPADAQRPTVLVGECGGSWVPHLRALGSWRMWIARRPARYDGEPWGLDNGAYRCHLAGRPFDEAGYLRRLERAHAAGVPYLAVVAGGVRSTAPAHRLCRWDLEFSLASFDAPAGGGREAGGEDPPRRAVRLCLGRAAADARADGPRC